MKNNKRESGIELLKIFAMFLIVISHVTATFILENMFEYTSDFQSSNNIKPILAWMQGLGWQGNICFWGGTAWFLLSSKEVNFKKIVNMISDVWVINVIFMTIFLVSGTEIEIQDIIKCLFPTAFAVNWYITCYIILYFIHPGLNHIIKSCSHEQLLKINIVAFALYCAANYINPGMFFSSNIIVFIVIYFIFAYIKLYMNNFCSSLKLNIIALIIGVTGTPLITFTAYYAGFQDNTVFQLANSFSPFTLITGISLFNLFKRKKFINNIINSIASMSLPIYIIHENLLIRKYIRPSIWIYAFNKTENLNVILLVLLQAVFYFAAALGTSYLYSIFLQGAVHKVNEKIYSFAAKKYNKFISLIMKID
ncbi:MAG: acyltransferase [Eubacterium sp.]|nr:acyltransferase [Eubacterium sp.]